MADEPLADEPASTLPAALRPEDGEDWKHECADDAEHEFRSALGWVADEDGPGSHRDSMCIKCLTPMTEKRAWRE